MDTRDLRYFVKVAQYENIRKAAELLSVTPGSLSKAIARLESALSIQLFHREGRHIRLTDAGKTLFQRGIDILQMLEQTRSEIAGSKKSIHLKLAGTEISLLRWGMAFSDYLQRDYKSVETSLFGSVEPIALDKLLNGEVHAAIISSLMIDTALTHGLEKAEIGKGKMQVCVGANHPILDECENNSVDVASLLKYSFVSPTGAYFGLQIADDRAADGWREHIFPRKIAYRTADLSIIDGLLTSGKAIAYLPDFYIKQKKYVTLNVIDCPYVADFSFYLVYRKDGSYGWFNNLIAYAQSS